MLIKTYFSLIFILTVLFFSMNLNGQSRTIIGRVISEDLEPLPMVHIQNSDTALLGKTDMDGRFTIRILQETNRLLFSFLGMEMSEVKLKTDCNTVEVVMLYDGTYDFMSLAKVDKLRKKRFDNLDNLHSDAIENGLFKNNNICYERVFEKINPPKTIRDSIKEEYKLKKKQIKDMFNRLSLGDTIGIPYYETLSYDRTDRTYLNPYSFTFDGEIFDCIIQGVIIEKNRNSGGYNLTYRVIDFNNCPYNSLIRNGEELKEGELINYDMKYSKILFLE